MYLSTSVLVFFRKFTIDKYTQGILEWDHLNSDQNSDCWVLCDVYVVINHIFS